MTTIFKLGNSWYRRDIVNGNVMVTDTYNPVKAVEALSAIYANLDTYKSASKGSPVHTQLMVHLKNAGMKAFHNVGPFTGDGAVPYTNEWIAAHSPASPMPPPPMPAAGATPTAWAHPFATIQGTGNPVNNQADPFVVPDDIDDLIGVADDLIDHLDPFLDEAPE